jgi:flavin reductase (DIM6/NTAB) family NADH-FMN oxidoreductase RutF
MVSKMTFTQRQFRDAMGHFPTGVTVVTARALSGYDIGVTANSFTSVSIKPPLISFNLAKSLRSFDDFLNVDNYAVNLLRKGQGQVSAAFARANTDKWSWVDCRRGMNDCPIFNSNLSVFECKKHAVYEGGDHMIFVGRVRRFDIDRDAEPLVFFHGRYCTLDRRAVND